MSLVIEKGVPIPPKTSLKGKKFTQWPFKDMELNDYVFIPYTFSPVARILSALKALERRSKDELQFTHRELPEGVGVWRTK